MTHPTRTFPRRSGGRWRFSALAACLLLPATLVSAGEPAVLILKDGERLTGSLEGSDEGVLTWRRSAGEDFNVPLHHIDRIEFAAPLLEPEPDPELQADAGPAGGLLNESGTDPDEDDVLTLTDELIVVVCRDYSDQCQSALREIGDWTQRITLGTRFRDGNSEEEFVDVGAKFKRETGNRLIGFDLGGQYGRANGRPTTNRWFGNVTFDANRKGNWILFLANRNEYDQFENLDYRVALAGGIGYRFFNEKTRRLIVRLGPGVTHERFHSPKLLRTTPDLLGELEVHWPLLDRAEFEHKTTITPSVEDLEVFRLESNYGVIVMLDDDERWSVEFSLRHEFNSRPNQNRRKNDYTTGVRLLYELK